MFATCEVCLSIPQRRYVPKAKITLWRKTLRGHQIAIYLSGFEVLVFLLSEPFELLCVPCMLPNSSTSPTTLNVDIVYFPNVRQRY